MNRVKIMRIDAANDRFRLIAPVIKDHGVSYEREKFEEKLTNRTLTLDRTTHWISASVDRSIQRETVTRDELVNGSPRKYAMIHSKAVLSLVTGDTIIKQTTCPETLLLDLNCLAKLQSNFKRTVTAATMMVTTSQVFADQSKLLTANDIQVQTILLMNIEMLKK